MSIIDLNINDTVTVSLTKRGLDVLREHIRKGGSSEGLEKAYHVVGHVYEFEIYELMWIFGESMGRANDSVFEFNRIGVEKERI